MYYNNPMPAGHGHNAGWLPYAQGLYTQHDDLVSQCMYILLHKERLRLGILNPFAEPFYPITEMDEHKDKQKTVRKKEQVELETTKKSINTQKSTGQKQQ